MPRPKASPASYKDVKPMLEFAKRNDGARFNCGTLGNAIRTVQRMNQFRIVDRRINYDIHKNRPPADPQKLYWHQLAVERMEFLASEYDNLIIRRPIDGYVIVDVKPDKPWIEAFDAHGNLVADIRTTEDIAAANQTIEVSPEWRALEQEIIRQHEERQTVTGGTIQAPREKHDPSKPLDLTDTDE